MRVEFYGCAEGLFIDTILTHLTSTKCRKILCSEAFKNTLCVPGLTEQTLWMAELLGAKATIVGRKLCLSGSSKTKESQPHCVTCFPARLILYFCTVWPGNAKVLFHEITPCLRVSPAVLRTNARVKVVRVKHAWAALAWRDIEKYIKEWLYFSSSLPCVLRPLILNTSRLFLV